MSHFVVLVVGENWEKQLEPFWELDLSPDEMKIDPRAEFVDHTDEYLNDYNTKTIKKVIMTDGRMLNTWDNEFKVQVQGDYKETKIPEELEQRDVPIKELFSTFEEYMKEWYSEEPNENGRYGYFHNPYAKWDWYSMGGRWSGYFRLKDNCHSFGTAKLGAPGVFNNSADEMGSGTRADQAKKGDIDFETMRKEYADRSIERYDKFYEIVNGREIPKWQEILKKWQDQKDSIENPTDVARREYNDNPVIIDLYKENFFFDIEDYFISRDEYYKNSYDEATVPYAVLIDGKWNQKGQMGWWGMSNDEKDQKIWNQEVTKLIDNLPDDEILTAVDCHI